MSAHHAYPGHTLVQLDPALVPYVQPEHMLVQLDPALVPYVHLDPLQRLLAQLYASIAHPEHIRVQLDPALVPYVQLEHLPTKTRPHNANYALFVTWASITMVQYRLAFMLDPPEICLWTTASRAHVKVI
jgi:hypothetical protein